MHLADYHVPGETTRVELTLEAIDDIKKRRSRSPPQPAAKMKSYSVEVVAAPIEITGPQLGTVESSTRAKTSVQTAMGISMEPSASPLRTGSQSLFFLDPAKT